MNQNTLALPPRSSRRNRRVCCASSSQPITKLDKQYEARSYAEIMQIHSTRERLALYEKTFEMCMRADPQLTAWIKRMKQKGAPKAMMEGYKPSARRRASEESLPSSSASSTISSSSSSNSVHDRKSFSSIFLRKASAGSSSMPSTPPAPTPAPQIKPCSSASRFITTSLSKLSSLSTRRRSSSGSSGNNNSKANATTMPPPSSAVVSSQDNSSTRLFTRRLRRSHDLRPKIAIQV